MRELTDKEIEAVAGGEKITIPDKEPVVIKFAQISIGYQPKRLPVSGYPSDPWWLVTRERRSIRGDWLSVGS